jgi:hypothetical protein
MMTEEQAKEKWCPFARVAGISSRGAINRDDKSGEPDVCARCIASDCMAWRSDGIEAHDDEVVHYGHCGLAGRP